MDGNKNDPWPERIPGPRGKEIMALFNRYKAPSVSEHPPVVWEKANGAVVEDVDGNTYIDFTSGIAITNAGHCPPLVVEAVKEQVEKLINCYDHPTYARAKLQEELAHLCPTDLKGDSINQVQLVTGGSEGVETAIKIARRYTGKYEVITTHGGFHGRASFLSMSLTDDIKYRRGYGPMFPGILHVPYAYCYRCPFELEYPKCKTFCAEQFERCIKYESTGNVAAFIVEPVQGAAGYIFPPDEYLIKVKQFCERHGILMIDDEIQSGFGRTGKFFGIEHTEVKPDIILLGKGIASGLPMTAVVAREGIFSSMIAGDHSTSYGGNPVSCAAALATIEQIRRDHLLDNSERIGKYILDRLLEMKQVHKLIGDVRGRGLMIGVELVKDREKKVPAKEEMRRLRGKVYQRGLLMVPAGVDGSIIRIAPPMVITEEFAADGLEILESAIAEVEAELGL
jgi:4-aminobutyrate aminotransferase/(S)-3-amino-2-methylpropionate transaminase